MTDTVLCNRWGCEGQSDIHKYCDCCGLTYCGRHIGQSANSKPICIDCYQKHYEPYVKPAQPKQITRGFNPVGSKKKT